MLSQSLIPFPNNHHIEINESSSESNNNIEIDIDKYEKMDQPVALYLFLAGQEQKR